MIELRVLGPVSLVGPDGTPADVVLVQPKRLAVLAYLALAAEPLVARERLLAVFWPESPERQAREALRQALRFLRRTLGEDVLVARGRSWVGASRERVSCDAWRFVALLEAGEVAGALELYGGELLDGLELRGAPAFDLWLTESRRELARRAAGAAWTLAEAARDRGDAEAALSYGWRGREIAPADEEGVRRLIGIHLWSGDRAGALGVYEEFEAWLAAEFNAVPSVRTRELAARARGTAPSPPSAGAARGVGASAGGRTPGPQAELGSVAEPASGTAAAPGLRAVPGAALRALGRWVPRRRAVRVPAAATLGGLVLLAVALPSVRLAGAGKTEVEAGSGEQGELLVVLPFGVRTAHPSLAFLRHGMADLLGAVFTGEVGPAAVAGANPPAWQGVAGRESADPLQVARRHGARWVVRGEVMGNERDVRVSGVLKDARGVRPTLTAAVSGPTDSIYALSRELGSRLLAMQAGLREDEAEKLSRTSPSALRAYLRGRQALRAAHYEDADRWFHQALRHDPRLAAAAVGLVETHLVAPWVRGHVFEVALPLAFRLQDEMGPGDREFVLAAAGPRYPERSTHGEYLQAWERAVARVPDRPAVWFQWGDALYHVGPFLGLPDHRGRARAAFEHALALDPGYLVPLTHLIEMATEDGDGARAAELLAMFVAGSGGDPKDADYLRWRVAVATGDSVALGQLRNRFPDMAAGSLGAIVRSASFMGAGLDDADRIAGLGITRWNVPSERWNLLVRLHTHALNRGRPSVARGLADAMRDVAPSPGQHLHIHVRSALGAGGDPAAARDAAAQLEAHVDLGHVSEQARRPALVADVCGLEVWKLHHGDTSTARRAIDWLRDPAVHGARPDAGGEHCAVFLDALLARHQRSPRLDDAIARVQVLVEQGVQLPGAGFEPVWRFLAETLEARGDLDCALQVVRRRSANPFMLAAQLRLEGRLATLTGDTAAARRAYTHYLALRRDAEPVLRNEVLDVQRALAALGDPTSTP